MPPAEKSTTYDLPTALRAIYLISAGALVGILEFLFVARQIGSESFRLLSAVVFTCGALGFYQVLLRAYKARYGVQE